MRKFHVTVNGVSYEVEVEEVGAAIAPAASPAVAAVPKAAPAAPAPAVEAPNAAPKVAAPVAAAAGEQIKAPMPGTIIDIKKPVGSQVAKGDILLILEAMKMENEIVASKDGTVAQVLVQKGASVNSGDVMVVLQ